MRSAKTSVIVVLALLALGGALLLPSATAIGEKKKKEGPTGIAQRVEVLEDEVADLSAKVAALEAGSCTCSCNVLHLEPLADFPESPSAGDLCVVVESDHQYLCCYLNGDWLKLGVGAPPMNPPILEE